MDKILKIFGLHFLSFILIRLKQNFAFQLKIISAWDTKQKIAHYLAGLSRPQITKPPIKPSFSESTCINEDDGI